MKVLLDANVLLSYLLSPGANSTMSHIIRYCLTTDIDLLLPREPVAEIGQVAKSKRFFQERIPFDQIDHLLAQLTALAALPPQLEEITAYGRDAKNDYLVAYGVINEADYLVTGDSDLLVLGQVGSRQIVMPSTFLSILEELGLAP